MLKIIIFWTKQTKNIWFNWTELHRKLTWTFFSVFFQVIWDILATWLPIPLYGGKLDLVLLPPVLLAILSSKYYTAPFQLDKLENKNKKNFLLRCDVSPNIVFFNFAAQLLKCKILKMWWRCNFFCSFFQLH